MSDLSLSLSQPMILLLYFLSPVQADNGKDRVAWWLPGSQTGSTHHRLHGTAHILLESCKGISSVYTKSSFCKLADYFKNLQKSIKCWLCCFHLIQTAHAAFYDNVCIFVLKVLEREHIMVFFSPKKALCIVSLPLMITFPGLQLLINFSTLPTMFSIITV